MFRNNDRRSKMISAPSNFNHISHMGPGDGIQMQRLLDLPSAMEMKADHQFGPSPPQLHHQYSSTGSHGPAGGIPLAGMSTSSSSTSIGGSSSPSHLIQQQQQQQGIQRVRSMFQQTGSKLSSAPRLPPQSSADPSPPRRSISQSGSPSVHNGNFCILESFGTF